MAENRVSLAKQACAIFAWAASKVPWIGDLTGVIADEICTRSDRKESYKKMRSLCFAIGRSPDDDATRNENLRTCLEALAELSAMKGNLASIRSFRISYLMAASDNRWYPRKWKGVPEEAK